MVYDVAVLGLGAMGSATTAELARRGARTVAFDRFSPPHVLGSTHGHTRIIREAYYEHPLYVPLVRRAYEMWSELETDSGNRMLFPTGGLMAGREDGELVRGALESARAHGIEYEMLDAAQIADRFPAYRARPEWVGLLEKRAGILLPERCVTAMLDRARRHGAELRVEDPVASWSLDDAGVAIHSESTTIRARQLVVAAGPWVTELSGSLGLDERHLPLEIERQLSHWFEPISPVDDRYLIPSCPIALWEAGADVFATFPDDGHGVKCGMHHAGASTSARDVDRTVSAAENEAARATLERVMPGAGGRLIDSRVCLYTNTPDRHFIIDWIPGSRDRVLLLSPCSGHGFKFAIAIGEIAAQLVLERRSWLDLAPFSLSRFE